LVPGYSRADHIVADRIAVADIVVDIVADRMVVVDTVVADRTVAAGRTVVDTVSAHIAAVDRAGTVVADRDCSAPGLADYRSELFERTDDRSYCKNVYQVRFHFRKTDK
jgi:erythromycin esterase-like protein